MRFRILVLALLCAMTGADSASGQEVPPFSQVISPFSKVATRYEISFRGYGIGSIQQLSLLDGNKYEMQSTTDVSLSTILSLEWKWASISKGILTSQGPRPSLHKMSFTKSGKRQSYDLAFEDENVTRLVRTPNSVTPKAFVPVTDQHHRDVIDPLSAFLVLTLYEDRSGSPCNQATRLFDGKLRFNVTMSPKRIQLLKRKTSDGRPVQARVCSAKWKPIAGHKPTGITTAFVTNSNDIEVFLIPVENFPSHYIPYLITVPTPFGSVTVKSVFVELTTANDKRISMIK